MVRDELELSFARAPDKCSIFFGDGLLDELPSRKIDGASSFAIITDDIVAKLYAKTLEQTLSKIAPTHLIVIPHGESSKNLDSASRLAAKLSKLGVDRKSSLFALGGGVIGDLTGFVASIFKRGIKYFQAPTTLLAQVDSSIGGKTAVDTEWGKNQLGSFYQPSEIFIDTSTLDTLPSKEIINGLGEMAKSSIIADRNLFSKINSALNKEIDIQTLKPLIFDTCKIKTRIVEEDEREMNLRSILNYGHTVGHALESSSGYKLSHGKSVVLGMISEGWISNRLGIFGERDYQKQIDLISKIRKQFEVTANFDTKKVLSFAFLDKKTAKGSIRMSLPEKIGLMHMAAEGHYTVPVSKELFVGSLSHLRQETD
ncbi:MAG: 3-dehydroquinate synthase [Thaumarchaeota archaeon]|nr:3-dehydroquinate synthase [Nitrososphaerota archaeon]